ncbi:uncharacterized protein LOC129776329 [Toxorhynchites rutilus septentrionalis]|uniref:uncharacterized protein LOC129776329 n=1 Tax=Toxorhynchites rutilus septentrionalis TaxID=329112 RepID=UPI002478EF4B|nr:uncharacterized protein LOC129776329 [Toxorhynchites rutilus septentrionalis]
MQIFKRKAFYFALLIVLLSMCLDETEARRKILRGRRTVTRTYKRGTIIPAWAIITVIGIAYLIVGGLTYLVLRKTVLQAPIENVNSYTPAMMQDDS